MLLADGKMTSQGKEGTWLQNVTYMRAKSMDLYGAYFPLVLTDSTNVL